MGATKGIRKCAKNARDGQSPFVEFRAVDLPPAWPGVLASSRLFSQDELSYNLSNCAAPCLLVG